MPLALILSSFVAASRIGGAAQQYVLAAHGIDPVLAPTSMYGRTPARGGVGEPTSPDVFRRILAEVEADALFGLVDLVITGHFSSAAQVEIAADTLTRVRAAVRGGAAAPRPWIVVDPIMGDYPNGLYVKLEVAEAIAARLVPVADVIVPNVWELERLTGEDLERPDEILAAARSLGPAALVTSVPGAPYEISLLLAERSSAVLFTHPRLARTPNGTGDLVTASLGAGLVQGLSLTDAATRAARAVAETVEAAREWRAPELPIVALAHRIVRPTATVRQETL